MTALQQPSTPLIAGLQQYCQRLHRVAHRQPFEPPTYGFKGDRGQPCPHSLPLPARPPVVMR
jgi:hypothetical protein